MPQKNLRQVKCVYCGKWIDRNLGFGYRQLPNKKWAHDNCAEFHSGDKKTKADAVEQIHQKMKQLCGDSYVKAKVDKQIKEYKESGKTPQNILKVLDYWYDIKNGDPEQANGGIGIVEYVYKDAMNYYERKEKMISQTNDVSPKIIEDIVAQQSRESGASIKKEGLKKPRKKIYFQLD